MGIGRTPASGSPPAATVVARRARGPFDFGGLTIDLICSNAGGSFVDIAVVNDKGELLF